MVELLTWAMAEDKISTGTDFYKRKGFVKALTLHLTEKQYEALRRRAFEDKTSLQLAARKALEKGLQK